MLNPRTMLRDSALIAAVMVAIALALGGLWWGVGALAGGLLGLADLFLITRLVARLVAEESNGVQLGLGLAVKTIGALGGMILLVRLLPPLAVMLGLSAIVLAPSIRGVATLFAAPSGAQEA